MAGCHFARLPCSLVAPRSRASLLTHPPLQLRHTQVVVVGGGSRKLLWWPQGRGGSVASQGFGDGTGTLADYLAAEF